MQLVRPSAVILSMTENPLQLIEQAGRVCYKSEDRITEVSAEPFITGIVKRGHESVIEHASATVRFIVDRGVSHEIVRHRIASYSQESTRYVNYDKKGMAFVIPSWFSLEKDSYYADLDILSSDFEEKLDEITSIEAEKHWIVAVNLAEEGYNKLISEGWTPEKARSVLPNSLKTELIMTTNFRSWRNFFKLRCAKAAHPQVREVAIPLLEDFKSRVPVIFDDIMEA